MPDFDTREKRFEQDIEASLLTHGGYQKGNPAAFDRARWIPAHSLSSSAPVSPSSGSATPASMARTASASSSSASAGRSGWRGF